MSARTALRAATAAEHERVDSLLSRFDLTERAGCRLFLLAQAAAFLPVEAALDEAGAERLVPDWPQRRRSEALHADLAALGAEPPTPALAIRFDTDEAVLGAVYVLEGSRLGGAMLKRALPPDFPRSFLDAPLPKGSWRNLLDNLDRFLYRDDQIELAAASARAVFGGFEAGGLRYLEK